MDQTQVQEFYNRLSRIEDKIDLLNEFKTSSVTSSKWVAFVVSGLCGLATIGVNCLIAYYTYSKT